MKSRFYLLLVSIFILSGIINAQTNQFISDVVAQINQDSVTYYIQSLQNFGSRFEYKENRKEVANWLKAQYLSMGFEEVELDSFMCDTQYGIFGAVMQYNVVATLPGTERPDEVYIIGGHYDSFNSYNDPLDSAPGADDNASGTTGALETARAIMKVGYQPEATIKFVNFAAEELMLYGYSGSEYMAESYREKGINIKLMINHDMIANNYDPVDESRIHVNYYTGNEYLKDIAIAKMNEYSRVTGVEGGKDIWTDSRSFHEEGFPAVYYDEFSFSPYYHTSDDVIENCDLEYCTEVIKGGAAMLIHSVESPAIVNNISAYDVGDGSSIRLIWEANSNSNFDHYEIFVGEQEDNLEYVNSTSDTSIVMSGLNEGTTYYFGIMAVDTDGDESHINQVSAIPHSLPRAPTAVIAKAKWQSIELTWDENEELDFMTYKIVKVPVALYDNFPPITYYTEDNSYTDLDIESGIWYDYTVYALDADSNHSINNTIVTSRAVTLDKGILFVNETTNGDGSIGNPTLEEVENFYSSLPASNFETYTVNMATEESFDVANLGAHQTVVWHIDKSSDVNTYQYLSVIKEYLDYGGNILFTGYKPSKAFENSTSMNNEFAEGDFLYDYLGVTESQNSIFALFKSAKSESAGYPDLELDPLKINTSDGHIKTIEAIFPADENNVIYSYVTDYEPTNVKGASSGKPVGIEYLSDDYNMILISLPLYYVKREQAVEFLNYILTNKFDTPTSVFDDENEDEVSTSFYLSQNYPNPFNPSTTIKFSVSDVGTSRDLSLRVYDTLGREVATLINEYKPAGTYEVTFDASHLSSGMYFYRLTSGSITQTRKMLLIK